MDKLNAVLLILGVSLTIWVGISAFVGFIFMLVWNAAIVGTFDSAPELSFWSAWGITFLLGLEANMFRVSVKSKES